MHTEKIKTHVLAGVWDFPETPKFENVNLSQKLALIFCLHSGLMPWFDNCIPVKSLQQSLQFSVGIAIRNPSIHKSHWTFRALASKHCQRAGCETGFMGTWACLDALDRSRYIHYIINSTSGRVHKRCNPSDGSIIHSAIWKKERGKRDLAPFPYRSVSCTSGDPCDKHPWRE